MSKANHTFVLVTVSGPDAPGITSELTSVLALGDIQIVDIGQSVIMGLLSLSILFELSEQSSQKLVIRDLNLKANALGLKLDSQIILPERLKHQEHLQKKDHHYVVTLLGDRISARALHKVATHFANHKLNIDQIERLSEEVFSAVELRVSSAEFQEKNVLKKDLLSIARECGIDVALQTEGLFRRTKRLVAFDMDSTLIQNEVIDELARQKGVYDEVARITRDAMGGRMDFDESLRRRVEKVQGLALSDLEEVFKRIKLTPGAEELILVLKKLGYRTALISGGFTFVAERLKAQLGIDYCHANTLEIADGKLTGKVIPPIINAQRKADLLTQICQTENIPLDQAVAVGDGANDLLMLEKAGLGIAFNAKPLVSERADLAVSQKNLRTILYLLGISGRDLAHALRPAKN